MDEIKLKVAETVQDDVNKGIVRIDSSYLQQINVKAGEIVEIEGERKTIAIVDRAYPGDIGLSIIRMDGLTRKNAKISIGEIVKIRKAQEIKEAKKITIAPARKGITVRADPNALKIGLLGRVVLKGDIIALGGARKRRNAMSRSPFEEIFSQTPNFNQNFGFGDLKFVVVEANPSKIPLIIGDNTVINLNPESVEVTDDPIIEVNYEDIGGLKEEIKKIREMVELPLKHPEIFERLGIEPPKGVLLHGPPGTGKTLLAKAVAHETNAHFVLINGPEIMSKFYGQSEENLRKKFEEAEQNAPSIIFIDEIDAIASKREETHGEVEKRVVAQLLGIMDGLKSRGKVVVIAASNIPNSLDPALRRPGRFDRELEIGVPSKDSRYSILQIHTRNMPIVPNYSVTIAKTTIDSTIEKIQDELQDLEFKDSKKFEKLKQNKENEIKILEKSKEKLEEIDQKTFRKIMTTQNSDILVEGEKSHIHNLLVQNMLQQISSVTHGFVGADLESLAKEAAMIVLRKIVPEFELRENEELPQVFLDKLKVKLDDFKEALKVVRPSAMREVFVEIPNVKWDDVGGLEIVKQELKEAVEWPLKHPLAFTRLGVRPPRGILLYGAPGTGKTLLAKAVANESEANFISVKGPELLSKWVGESEKGVRQVFKKARQNAPTIIFFDEIDSIAPRRSMSSDHKVTESMVNQLLTEMDGLEALNDVIVIAATNRPDILDTALLRPGRFDRIILTPAPDEKTRLEILKVHTEHMKLSKDVNLKEVAEKTDGYVGADLESVCREAAMLALRKDIKATEVTKDNYDDALNKVRPSVTKDIEEVYKNLANHFSSAKAEEIKKSKPNYFG